MAGRPAAGVHTVGTVGRVSTPGRPVYIELLVPSQHTGKLAQTGTGKSFMSVALYFL